MFDAKVKLLIVDDEPDTRFAMSEIFKGLGHEVRTAEEGFSALVQMRHALPDILISDLHMPGMSGFELLSVVRRRYSSIHVIAMSGQFADISSQPGVAADAFYQKGAGIEVLFRTVKVIADAHLQHLFPHRGNIAPVWIPSNGHHASGKSYVVLVCPECLRTFPEVLGGPASLIHEAACVHCSNLIHYAILQPTNPAVPQAFQPVRELDAFLSHAI